MQSPRFPLTFPHIFKVKTKYRAITNFSRIRTILDSVPKQGVLKICQHSLFGTPPL